MRMLVLGAGQQGTACAYDLLRHTEANVIIADLNVGALPDFLEPFAGDRLTAISLDVREGAATREALTGVTATMSALPYYLNLDVAAAAIAAGSHFCDLGGNTEIVTRQKEFHSRAMERGISVIPDCGLAPGMVNILAEYGIQLLDEPRSVRIKVGGLPQHPEPPLDYQIVYSLEGVLDYYTTLSWIIRDGELEQVEALSEIEKVTFPGVGELEAFHTAGGISTMAQRHVGDLSAMEYKTLRYPGHADVMRVIRELGLLSLDPVIVDGKRIVPRDVFMTVAGPKLRRDPRCSPDVVAMRVEAEGRKNGREVTLRWELLDAFDPETGITAMMRTTGFSLAITGQFQAEGRIKPGVWTPDEAMPAAAYIDALRERGMDIRFTEVPGRGD